MTDPQPKGWDWTPPLALVLCAAGLWAFWAASADAPSAGFSLNGHPPVYGAVSPRGGFAVLLALAVAVVAAWAVSRAPRRPAGLLVLVPAAVLVSFAVNSIRGVHSLARSLHPSVRFQDYGFDAGVLERVGVRSWLQDYPALYSQLQSAHTRTHPPGALLLYEALRGLPGGTPVAVLTIAVLTVLMTIPAYLLISAFVRPEVALPGAALVVFSPAVLSFAFTSLDGVFATVLATCAALLALSVRQGSARGALVGGAALGLSTFVTYAGVFVALAVGLYALAVLRGRTLVRWVGAAVAGTLLVVLLLRTTGYDLMASYLAVDKTITSQRSFGYWLLGTPVLYLIALGVPLAALSLLRLGTRRPPLLPLALMVPLLVFAALPASLTGLVPGEIERTWLFTIPVTALLATDRFRVWEERSDPGRRWLLPSLLVLAAIEAVLLNMTYDMYW